MKASFFALAVVAALGSAQDISSIPSCALPCLASASVAAGCTDLTDAACACGPAQATIASGAAACLISACNSADLATAQQVGLGLCAAYNSAVSAGSSATGSASSAATSAAGSITSSAGTASPTAASTSSSRNATVTSASPSSTSSGSVSASSNAANAMFSGVAGLAAVVAGAVAMI